LSTFVSNHDFVSSQPARNRPIFGKTPGPAPGIDLPSAQNLHNNPQILNGLSKRAANRPCIVTAWRRSSRFNFDDRGCPGGS
jgi:hypothetical protein